MAKYRITDSRLIPSREPSRAGLFDTLITFANVDTNAIYFTIVAGDKPSQADIGKAIAEYDKYRKQHVGKEFSV